RRDGPAKGSIPLSFLFPSLTIPGINGDRPRPSVRKLVPGAAILRLFPFCNLQYQITQFERRSERSTSRTECQSYNGSCVNKSMFMDMSMKSWKNYSC